MTLNSAAALPSLSASCCWCHLHGSPLMALCSRDMTVCCRRVAARRGVATADHCSSGAATAVPHPEHTAAAAGLLGCCPAAQSWCAQEGGQPATASSWSAAADWARTGSSGAAVPAGRQPAVVVPVALAQHPCTGALTWLCPQTCLDTHVLAFCTHRMPIVLLCCKRIWSSALADNASGNHHEWGRACHLGLMIHCMPVDAAETSWFPLSLWRAGRARQLVP